MRTLLCLVSVITPLAAAPMVVNDLKLAKSMADGIGKTVDDKSATGIATLTESLTKVPKSIKLEVPSHSSHVDGYDALIRSVAILGPVFKCTKCAHWHLGGTATAWCLSAEGVFVTNYHVFLKPKGEAMGICLPDGRTVPVKEILAANEDDDVCLFRVDGKDFTPLSLAEPAAVGTKVHLISHPDGRFFFQSSGEVARYHSNPPKPNHQPATWMSITADFAKGSSGGPVVNDMGQVVGMVSSTQSIYYDSNKGESKGPLQMVVKNCVPSEAIRRLLNPE